LVYDATIGPSDPSIGLDDTVPVAIASSKPRRVDQTIPFGFPQGEKRLNRAAARQRQRRAFVPDESNGCYLLTKRKVEPRVIIAAEQHLNVHRDPTLIMTPPEFRNPVTPRPMARIEPKKASLTKSRPKPSFSSRAKALAAAFWGHWGEGREHRP
jgi:hypothetical protein